MSKLLIVGFYCLVFTLAVKYPTLTSREGDKSIPLKSIDYSIHARDGLMSVCISQVYKNEYPHPIDAKYVFPINYHMATTNLTIRFSHDDSLLVAKLKPKSNAREFYEEAKSRGHGAAYMEFDTAQKDMISIDLGNVLSNEILEVKITFVQELRVEDLSWAIRIPTTFIPPYPTAGQTSRSSGASITHHGAYSMTLNLVIDSLSPITRLISPSHEIDFKFNSEYTRAQVYLKNEYDSPDRDIVILYRNADIANPQLIVQKSLEHDTYAVLLSYLPLLDHLPHTRLDLDRATRYYDSKRYLNAKSEFVFLIDCSGSMWGRINQAREATKLFIKSLPTDSYFTFVFFGSSYRIAPPGRSVRYTKETSSRAWEYLSELKADMGGTELDSAMEYVLSMPRVEGYTRNILVMTDGEVSRPEKTINLVKRNLGNSFVSAIGIGAGASRHLVEGLAEAGKGKSYFITEDETIMPKVIEVLNNICVDTLRDVRVRWHVAPQYSYEPKIGFYGEPLIATAIFKEKPSGKITISGYGSKYGNYFEKTFDLASIKQKEGTDIYQLAIKQKFNSKTIEDKEIIAYLSMKYSVLSDETAFVARKIYYYPTDRRTVKEIKVPIMETRESGYFYPQSSNSMYKANANSIPKSPSYSGRGESISDMGNIRFGSSMENLKEKMSDKNSGGGGIYNNEANIRESIPPSTDRIAQDAFSLIEELEDTPMMLDGHYTAMDAEGEPELMSYEAKADLLFDKIRMAGVKETKKDLMKLISLQNPDGSFELSPEIIKESLDMEIKDIKGKISKDSSLFTNEKALATVLMLIIIDKEHSQTPEMALVRMKTIEWLKNHGIVYDKVKQELDSLISKKTDL